jgi:hypothetical protein
VLFPPLFVLSGLQSPTVTSLSATEIMPTTNVKDSWFKSQLRIQLRIVSNAIRPFDLAQEVKLTILGLHDSR